MEKFPSLPPIPHPHHLHTHSLCAVIVVMIIGQIKGEKKKDGEI